MKQKTALFILLAGLLSMLLIATGVSAGCGGGNNESSAVSTPAATQPASSSTAGSITTATGELALGQGLTLDAEPLQESSQSPLYTVDGQEPVLKGMADSRVEQFNQQVTGIIEPVISKFKQDVATWSASRSTPNGSSLRINFEQRSPPGTVISLVLKFSTFFGGAAYPNGAVQTVNYDLQRGKSLALAELFLPGTPYLDILSAYCQEELARRGMSVSKSVTAPREDNYRNWALTAEGVEITFDESQGVPHVLGSPAVLVHYDRLQKELDPKGPAASIRK